MTTMIPRSRNALFGVMLVAAAMSPGCLHRSPLWSPDGERLLILSGAEGEPIEAPASRLWLLHVATSAVTAIAPPEQSARFLSAAWLSDDEFVAATGIWADDAIRDGSTKLWRRKLGDAEWRRFEAPAPSAQRSLYRLPLAFEHTSGPAIAYDSGDEKLVVVSLATGAEIRAYEYADLIGAGPGGGFIYAYENDAGDIEIHSIAGNLDESWKITLSALRPKIAETTGRSLLSVAINHVATSELPRPGDTAEQIGITACFSDVGWRKGFPGYYLSLDAKTGELRGAVHATVSSGRAAWSGGRVRALRARDEAAKTPPELGEVDIAKGDARAVHAYEDIDPAALHGYAADPAGKRFAVAIHGAKPRIEIWDASGEKTVIGLGGR